MNPVESITRDNLIETMSAYSCSEVSNILDNSLGDIIKLLCNRIKELKEETPNTPSKHELIRLFEQYKSFSPEVYERIVENYEIFDIIEFLCKQVKYHKEHEEYWKNRFKQTAEHLKECEEILDMHEAEFSNTY